MMASAPPRIAILMATYNGARHLQAQLDSFAAQSLPPVHILVSDDGSTDETCDMIEAFARAHPALGVRLIQGPGQGAVRNFLYLMGQIPEDVDMVALSDQDDVWLPEKLARGAAALQTADETAPDRPRLYCGRTWECDETLSHRHLSRDRRRPPGFGHALVQNIAGGNTMLLNSAACRLVRAAVGEVRRVAVHDWWIYQIITGAGGEVLFDRTPMMLYRQHQSNQIGANRGLRAKCARLKILFSGGYQRWTSLNLVALFASAHRLTPRNRARLTALREGRRGGLITRLRTLQKSGIYRQGLAGQLSLVLALALGRM